MAILGFLLMLGTAGASDLGAISLTRLIVQELIGLILFTAGLYRKGVFYRWIMCAMTVGRALMNRITIRRRTASLTVCTSDSGRARVAGVATTLWSISGRCCTMITKFLLGVLLGFIRGLFFKSKWWARGSCARALLMSAAIRSCVLVRRASLKTRVSLS